MEQGEFSVSAAHERITNVDVVRDWHAIRETVVSLLCYWHPGL